MTDIPGICIAIQTKKFSVLAGEQDEPINAGMYGKALCQYLEAELPRIGVEVPSYACEDWGWWVDVNDGGFNMGLCIYSWPEAGEAGEAPERYAIMPSVKGGMKWSWLKFRNIAVSEKVVGVMDRVEALFRQGRDVEHVSRHDDYPF
jgi:hypothetical protein